jgi:Holliday junction resolvase RusA-like endonuclease
MTAVVKSFYADPGLPWLEFELPAPPSVNRLMGKLGNRTPAVQKWIRQADMAFTLERSRRTITSLCGAYEAQFIFARRSNSDLDNRCKPLMDYLQRVQIIENDRLCERLELIWGCLPQGRVKVRLRPWICPPSP